MNTDDIQNLSADEIQSLEYCKMVSDEVYIDKLLEFANKYMKENNELKALLCLKMADNDLYVNKAIELGDLYLETDVDKALIYYNMSEDDTYIAKANDKKKELELEQDVIDYYKTTDAEVFVEKMEELGDYYLYEQKDIDKALKHYKLAGDDIYQDKLEDVADMYFYGDGVEKDRKKAMTYYKMSCPDDDNKISLNKLEEIGDMYLEKDETVALEYYSLLGQKMYNKKMIEIGDSYLEKNEEKAMSYYKLAGEKEYIKKLKKLADNNYNPDTYLKYYKMAADEGNLEAIRIVGKLYIQNNIDNALKYYKMLEKGEDLYIDDMLEHAEMHNNDYVRIIEYTRNKITELQEQLNQKDAEILDLKYRPGGPGYEEAKERFEKVSNS